LLLVRKVLQLKFQRILYLYISSYNIANMNAAEVQACIAVIVCATSNNNLTSEWPWRPHKIFSLVKRLILLLLLLLLFNFNVRI
jgi:hypothetical protein